MKFSSEWSVVRLKDVIVDMQPGFAQRPGEEEGSIGQIRTHNVSPDGQITLNGLKRVTPSGAEAKKYSLEPGDIIFNNTNSEEWVGKTALFELEEPLAFSNHMTRIRANNSLIMPSFLARYLHFLWSIGFSKTRAKRWVSQAGIDQKELASFKLPLPTLPEQKRIVDILNQAEELRHLCQKRSPQFSTLRQIVFTHFFGRYDELEKEKIPLECLTKFITSGSRDWSKYYSSSKNDAIFIRVQNIKEGKLDLSDIAYVLAPDNAESERARVQPFDLLISITGTIGQVAIVPEDMGEAYISQHVALVRTDRSVPVEFIAEYLNHPAGGQLQIGRANYGQTKPGLNLQQITKLNIPIVRKEKQEKFLSTLKDIDSLIEETIATEVLLKDLQTNLLHEAFSGALTTQWRKENQQSILEAVKHRSDVLGGAQQKGKIRQKSRNKVTITEIAPDERKTVQLHHRHWLFEQLSEIQVGVLQAIRRGWSGTLIPSEDLDEFIGRSFQIEHLEDANDQIKRALNQLAGLGLIAKISIPNQAGEYVTGYRGLREDELTQVSDGQFLARG
jgi:type I restriction enzyme S subunit